MILIIHYCAVTHSENILIGLFFSQTRECACEIWSLFLRSAKLPNGTACY